MVLTEQSADAYLKRFDDPHALAGPIRMSDGSLVARLPGIGRWMWDGEFCGTIGLRWSPGTMHLPPTYIENVIWQRVILANGGVLVDQFEKIPVHGGGQALRFRIDL